IRYHPHGCPTPRARPSQTCPARSWSSFWSCCLFGSGLMDCLDRLLAKLLTRLLRALGKLNDWLPCRVAVLCFVCSRRKADPFLAVLLVPSAIVQHEPDAR